MPAELRGLPWLRPANDNSDQEYAARPLAELLCDAEVYVAHDTRAAVPDWLADWEPLELSLGAAAPGEVSFRLWRRRFAAGEVLRAGWNGQLGGAGMYLIILRPAAPAEQVARLLEAR